MKLNLFSVLFLMIAAVSNLNAQVSAENFLQDIKTDIALPSEAGKNVIKMFQTLNQVVVVTSNGIFKYRNGNWSNQPDGSAWKTAAIDKTGKVWLASVNTIQMENKGEKLILPESAKSDTILCLFWEDGNTLQVGTTGGLLTWNGKWNTHSEIKARVNAVVSDAQKQLWVATTNGLWRRSTGKWVNMDDTMMDPGNGRTYFSLQQQKEGAEILLSTPYSVGCISETGNHWVLRAADGLPYGPVKVIAPADVCLWLGTEKGVIKKDSG